MASRKVAVVVQARMGSSRLPGKVLFKLANTTVLGSTVARAKQAPVASTVIVATTQKEEDDQIVSYLEGTDTLVVRGSEHNVFDRYYKAAKIVSADVVVRLTSDCPLIDPATIAQAVEAFDQGNVDYVSAGLAGGYCRGLDVEVFSTSAMERALNLLSTSYQKEHVTPIFYQTPETFRVLQLQAPPDLRSTGLRLCVDTPEDYAVICDLFERFYDPKVNSINVAECIRRLKSTFPPYHTFPGLKEMS